MDAGFREIRHTADWELEVWAPDFLMLLEQAARGMYALCGTCLQTGKPVHRSLSIQMADPESVLIRFLGELLFLGEHEHLGFNRFDLRLEEGRLHALLTGAPVVSQYKEIKAVTYHNLVVRETSSGLVVNIVFDV